MCKKRGRAIGSGRETRKKHRRTERGGVRPMPSPLEKRREKELHLQLGPEGAPWGQPSEKRALWTAVGSLSATILSTVALSFVYSTDLSTGPPRPPRPAVSYLLLVTGSRERVSKNKGVSVDVRKRRGSVLLSVAAKLREVAERDL